MEPTPDQLVVEEINKRNTYNAERQSITTGSVIPLTEEEYLRDIQLQTFSNSIKILCCVDAFINTIYIYYGYEICYLFVLCSFLGYFGTVNYNKLAILAYLVYQYLMTFFRISILIFYILLASSSEYRNRIKTQYPEITLPSNYIQDITVMAIIFICQFFINVVVHHFYILIPKNRIVYNPHQIRSV